jgi:two-component system, OmpR family, sensor histidine kinase VicK
LTFSSFPSIKGKGEEVTRVFYGVETVINTVLQFLNQTNDIIYACVDQTRPVLTIDIPELREAFLNAKNRGVKLRYITEITKDNISYCKQLHTTMVDEFRHLDGIKGNFYISETGYLAPATFHEKGKPASQIIYSNVMELIEHQNYVFESFWNKSVPAEQKIREIEEGIESEFTEVITDGKKAADLITEFAKSVKREAQIILPYDKTMIRTDKLGMWDHLIQASNQKKANIRVVCPITNINAHIANRISLIAPNIKILNSNESVAGLFIVDNERFFRSEDKNPETDDNDDDVSNAISLMIYSNSKKGVNSFKAFFELLWKQTELYEQLKVHDRMQKEFINVAAHELRTPIQPILGLSEILQSKIKDNEQRRLIDVISRNAKRLQRLTEDILDITKIESQTLKLNKEKINLNEKILNVINDVKGQIHNPDKLQIVFSELKEPLYIEADKIRLYQTIANLLNNAIKFTKEGTISINADMKEDNSEVIITIRDTGAGIDPEILPRLFTKFATKSATGTGLGLFISKSIVEAHGGRMWTENSPDGKGAIFSFSLPLLENQ